MANDQLNNNSLTDLTLFVPCLNEEANIAGTLQTIREAIEKMGLNYEILVIDDGSADQTVAIASGLATQNPHWNVEIHTNKSNKGLGHSYFKAAGIAKGTYFMMVHGKNVMTSEAIREIVSYRQKEDIIVTYVADDHRSQVRMFLSGLFTKLVCAFSGHKLRYFNGSVLHLTRNVRNQLGIGVGFAYQAELLCRLLDSGATYKELPIRYELRKNGRTKAFRIKNILSVTAALFRILIRRIKNY